MSVRLTGVSNSLFSIADDDDVSDDHHQHDDDSNYQLLSSTTILAWLPVAKNS